jgi:hypothetical protein
MYLDPERQRRFRWVDQMMYHLQVGDQMMYHLQVGDQIMYHLQAVDQMMYLLALGPHH